MTFSAQRQGTRIETSEEYVFRETERLNGLFVSEPYPDLVKIAKHQHVRSIMRTSLPSEAFMEAVSGGFQIYLNSARFQNIDLDKSEPPLSWRDRFSLAHEIIHTFFYVWPKTSDLNRVKPKLLRGARSVTLEGLCQFGANRLLLPERSLREWLAESGGKVSVTGILKYSKRMRVNAEPAFQRLLGASRVILKEGQCFLYLKKSKSEPADLREPAFEPSAWTIIHTLYGPGQLGNYHAELERGAMLKDQFYAEDLILDEMIKEHGQDLKYGDAVLKRYLAWANPEETEAILELQHV